MKKQLILLMGILFLCSSNVFSQEEKEMQYLLSGSNRPSISGFGGPMVEFSSVEGDFAVFVGGGGAIIFNQTFYFGGYGEGLTTSHYRYDLSDITDIQEPKISLGHGGFWLGYVNKSFKAIHPAASLKIGWGKISLYDDNWNDYNPENYVAQDGIFTLIPQLEVEVNLTSWFKLNVGAGYRWMTGMDKQYSQGGTMYDYYESSDYSSPVGTISLLFGGFAVK
ncbi:MAG TPA: hypothetical protein PK711_10600 [Bacteroidales bacterium]|nr:hypothetical protein [Bacteroidales bacterium]HRZ22056.1 hypothetical protein [Bacteroidales bacterium]